MSSCSSAKKRRVLQPTIKCFMNSHHSTSGEDSECNTPPEPPSRGRSGPRSRPRHHPKTDFRSQPPIELFMNSGKSRTGVGVGVGGQSEGDKGESRPKSQEDPIPNARADPTKENSKESTNKKYLSKGEQAAMLDIRINSEITVFMKSVCLRTPNMRYQADMDLLKMIMDFNPHLKKEDTPFVWLRMQKGLCEMGLKYQEEMEQLKREREAAAAASVAAAAAAAAARAAAFEAENFRRQQLLEQMRRNEMEAALRREQLAHERLQRERVFNQQLYNAVHDLNRGPSSVPQLNRPHWDGLKETILAQIVQHDKDPATLVKFVYAHYPPKGKIRIDEEAVKQIAFLQFHQDPESKKRVKMLLLKVIQDYHPDKVKEEHGEKWKTISEEIVKRVTKYYENLK